MSVSDTDVKQVFDADGATTTFAIPFAYIADEGSSFVKVYTYDEDTGEATLKTITTHYTLSPNNSNPTNVVFVSAPADGLKVLLIRQSSFIQSTEYEDDVPFPAQTHEEALDRLLLMLQEVKEKADRALKLNVLNGTDIGSEIRKLSTAGALLQINDDLNAIEEGPTYQSILDAEEAAELAASQADASASAAASSANAAAASAAAAATAETNAETAETNAETAQAAAEAAQAAAEAAAAAAAAAEVVVGTRAAPTAVVAGTGIVAPTSTADHLCYIEGSGGAVDVSANPQIAAGLRNGQRMTLRGRSSTNTVLLEHGTGLVMNGSYNLGDDSSIVFRWDLTNWVEESRNGL